MAELRLTDARGAHAGTIQITPVSKLKDAEVQSGLKPVEDLSDSPDLFPEQERLQLLEGFEYRYVVLGIEDPFVIEPPDLFSRDPDDHRSGRLRPALSTGSVAVYLRHPEARPEEEPLARGGFEVRSRKLGYADEYRRMLEDLTEWFTALVLERFAPSELTLRIDEAADAPTLYQRFAFIKSLIEAEPFQAAMQQILSRPHTRWVEELEPRRPGQAIPPSSAVTRQLAGPGRRVAWPGAPKGHLLQSLPASILVPRSVESRDTPENRFVRFVLERWQELVLQVRDALAKEKTSSPVARGIREVDALLGRLSEWLQAPLFADVGRLTLLPGNSQVLQKRAGYRDLFRAFIQVEAAAALSWQGEGDLFRAGQRDVAKLYELWVLYQVATLVAKATELPWDGAALLQVGANGLGINLKGGEAPVLAGTIERQGRSLDVKLYYNLTFGKERTQEFWSRPMRPDLSLCIQTAEGSRPSFEPVWIHLDAKYRISKIADFYGAPDDEIIEKEEASTRQGKVLRSDLLKMHAYRDAIKRSAGAYVIYPGNPESPMGSGTAKEPTHWQRYHEILPGLGAFPLRPEPDGQEPNTDDLRVFLEEVFTHLASQVTQHERSRFWEREIFEERPPKVVQELPVVPFLATPPADAKVLIGYLRDAEWHLRWIERQRLYNLRADVNRRGAIRLDSDALNARFLLLHNKERPDLRLYRIDGEPRILTDVALRATGYADPGGERYLCLPITERLEMDSRIEAVLKQWLQAKLTPGEQDGEPRTVTWLELLSL